MPNQSPCGIPPQFESGNSLQFTESFTCFPASEWALTLYLSQQGVAAFNVAAEADGDNFSFTITPTQSATIAAGIYDFAEYATKTNERQTARTGVVVVLPNLTVSQPKSDNQIALEAITAAINKLALGTEKMVNFNGQQFEKRDLSDLIKQQTYFKAQVIYDQRVQAALRGDRQDGRIPIHFVPPSDVAPFGYGNWPFQR